MLPPDAVLRFVPDEWKEMLAAGAVKVVGNLILPTSGPNRILAHLQPTALGDAATPFLSIASGFASGGPLGGIAQAANEVAALYSGFEAAKLRAAVEAMQGMQVAGLALSGVGIGVSVAGFAALAYKLNAIEQRLVSMTDKLDRVQHTLQRRDQIDRARAFERLRTTVERVDDAWDRPDAQRIWQDEERELHYHQREFLLLADVALRERDGFALAEPLIEAASVAGTTRTTALLASDEVQPALRQSREFASALLRLTSPIGAARLLEERVTLRPGQAGYVSALSEARPLAEADAALIRSREDAVQTAQITIDKLKTLGIGGREWLERARSEREQPFIVLRPV
jgi:hypothetical protein